MKKEHLIAVIAVCAVVIAGIMVFNSYEKHKRMEEFRRAQEAARLAQQEEQRKIDESNRRAQEWLRKFKEGTLGQEKQK